MKAVLMNKFFMQANLLYSSMTLLFLGHPDGSSIQNVLPTPSSLSTPMLPPIISTSCLVMVSPIPVPSTEPNSAPSLLNGAKISASRSFGIPIPASMMLSLTLSSDVCLHAALTLPPFWLYFIAFDSRLITTCLSRVRSAHTLTRRQQESSTTETVISCCSPIGLTSARHSFTIDRRSTCSSLRSSFPDSILARSSNSLMIEYK